MSEMPLPQRRWLAPRRRRPRGQVIVLGALTVLLLSFALMISVGMSWTVRERIRVQNAADANAYSTAVHVARAYNYFAYSNRAIAGAYVAEAMLSAYHSEIAAAADLYWGAALAYMEMAGEEFAMGCCGTCIYTCCPCLCFQHCEHALEDVIQAGEFIASASEMSNDIKDMDPPFRDAMEAWRDMINSLLDSQTQLRSEMYIRLGTGGATLADENVPQGKAGLIQLGALNAMHFSDAIDTRETDNKQRDMTEVINASRPSWTRARGDLSNFPAMAFSTVVLEPLGEKLREKANGGFFIFTQIPLGIGGAAGAADNGSVGFMWSPPPGPNIRADSIASRDWWTFEGFCKHNCAVGISISPLIGPILPGKINTRQSGDEHRGGLIQAAHDGQPHRQIEPRTLRNYLSYNTQDASRAPWRQPAIYGYAEKNLAHGPDGKLRPFYITNSGITSPTLVGRQVALHLASTETSRAVSKALVYYHRIGLWKCRPNFFNPYWRVKLHPFSDTEWAVVTGAALCPTAAFVGTLGVGTAEGDPAMAP